MAQVEEDHDHYEAEPTPTAPPVDPDEAAAVDAAALEVGERFVRELVAWPVELREWSQPFSIWAGHLGENPDVAEDAQLSVVPLGVLNRIANDALGHLALPKVVAVHDQTLRTDVTAGSGQVTLTVDVVFVNEGGWTRPGMHLTVDVQVTDRLVTAMVINDGYVTEDAELVP